MKIFHFLWDYLFMYICLIYCKICGRIVAQLYIYPEKENLCILRIPFVIFLLEIHWNYTGADPAGESGREKKHTKFSIFTIHLHATKLSDVSLLPWKIGPKMFRLPTWNFGIRPCNCVFKNVCITIHVLWIIIAICYCYYELWIKESRFIGINSLIKDRY